VIVSSVLASTLHFAHWIPLALPPASHEQAPAAQTPAAKAPAAQAPAAQAPKSATADKPAFKQEELDQMLAPVALYPDSLLSQVLMASTYPIEVVEAERWAKANKALKGDAKAKALEQQKWDPSVKSLTDFVPVLEMMSSKLDWTQKLGDAFLGQQKEVMETVQKLRNKAKESGNLESNKDMKVTTTEADPVDVIVIESTSPSVVYVPTYTTAVYGTWWYPAYPPYPYYPPGAAFWTFACGVAWGYAWGNCNWGGDDIDIDVNRNTEFNRNIDRERDRERANQRDKQRGNNGKGKWQHDASHRGNAPYRDNATARKNGGVSTNDAARARDQYRGKAEAGRGELSRGAADQFKTGPADRSAPGAGRTAAGGGRNTGASGGAKPAARPSSTPASQRGTRAASTTRASSGSGALTGVRSGGASARSSSARGSASRGGGGRGGGRGGRR
jgi:hypothetical protein